MNLIERQHGFGTSRDEPPPPPPVDRETFQQWASRQERRYEWVRGEIVMMTDVSRGHARIVTRLVIALSSRLDLDRYEIATSDFGVNTPGSRRYPDVLVEEVNPDLKGRTSETPIFIGEVLSPSSIPVDMRQKQPSTRPWRACKPMRCSARTSRRFGCGSAARVACPKSQRA